MILQYDYAPTAHPIMGIKPYFAPDGSQQIMIFDTLRVGKVITLAGAMQTLQQANYGISEIPHQVLAVITPGGFGGGGATFTGTLAAGIFPGDVVFSRYNSAGVLQETVKDNGDSLLTGYNTATPPVATATTGYINYATGAWTITFAAAPAAGDTLNVGYCVYGDTFTGTFSNFFDVANLDTFAFLTNGVDQPRYYDGTCIKLLNTNLTSKPNSVTFDLSKVLHMVAHNSRLVLLSVFNNSVPELNAAYWSVLNDPLNFVTADGAGQEFASTSEAIKSFAVINTDLIVHFSNSQYILRITNDAFDPFRFDKTNSVWRCDASYSAINYDSYFTDVGRPAITGSDGVNIQRVDEIIPDFTLNQNVNGQQPVISIDQTSIAQCYGERFDDFKEGWLCYKGYNANEGTSVQPSDSVLAFNYLDKTYAVYTFPFSCLGYGRVSNAELWGNDFGIWESDNSSWDSFADTFNSLIDLGGDQFGTVFELGRDYLTGSFKSGLVTGVSKAFNAVVTATNTLTAGQYVYISGVGGMTEINNKVYTVISATGSSFVINVNSLTFTTFSGNGNWYLVNPVFIDIITKNFNPFVESGQLCRFGYIDFLVSGNNNTSLRVQFYANDTLDSDFDTAFQESTITFTDTDVDESNQQNKVWKRIYVGAVANSFTMRIYQSPDDFTQTTLNQPVRIHAMVLWMKAAGRIIG